MDSNAIDSSALPAAPVDVDTTAPAPMVDSDADSPAAMVVSDAGAPVPLAASGEGTNDRAAAAKPSAADDDDEEEDADETGLKWKKERVAVVFGYIGARFQGLQRNPGAFAVEDELEGAIFRAGGISKENVGDFHKVGWSRAARTDKGVHAMGQVISLRMRVPLFNAPEGDPLRGTVDYMLMRDRINAQLAGDMRVFDVCRVTGTFNAHTLCSGRQYEYVLPTLVLQPPRPVAVVSKPPPVPQVFKRVASSRAADSFTDLTGDRFANGVAASLGAREAGAARAAGAAAAASVRAAVDEVLARAASAVPPPPSHGAPSTAPDPFQTGAAFTSARLELCASRAALALADTPGPNFRVRAAVLARLGTAVACFRGTHAFHNFTPRLTFGDASTSRYISDARVSAPFVVGEGAAALECVRVTFVGQSFLLNQIRHMVALAADVARGAAPAFMMQVAFGYAVVKLPLAPAEGLYLDRCFYSAYDRQTQALPPPQRGAKRKVYPLLTTRSPSGDAATEAFRRDVLLPHMLHSVSEVRPFHAYIAELLREPMRYRVNIPRNLAEMLERGAIVKRNPAAGAPGALKRGREEAGAGAPPAAGAVPIGIGGGADGDGLSALEWMAQFGGAAAAAAVATSGDSAAAALVFAPVDVALLNGGCVSKEAIARSEFRQQQKLIRSSRGGGGGGGGGPRPNVWQQDSAPEGRGAGDAEGGAEGAAVEAAKPQSGGGVWRGGARSSAWRGGARRGGRGGAAASGGR